MRRFIALLLLVIVVLPLASAQVLPSSANIKIRGGEELTVNFSIVNIRNESVFFVVNYPYMSGWSINVTPTSGIIKSDGSQLITVHIKAPKSYGMSDFNLPFEVVIYNEKGEVGKYVYSLHVSFLSTPFYLFEIPWPASWGYWGTFLNVVITWMLITFILYLLFPYLKKLTKITKTKVDDVIVEILHKPVTIWVISYGLTTALLTLPPISWLFPLIIEAYNIVVVVLVTWIAYRFFKDVVIYYMFHLSKGKKGDLENVLIPILEKLGIVTIGTLGGLMILQIVGVNVSVLLASMGIAGIVLGLAAQQTLGNFFSGLHILIDKAFRIGDLIMLENSDGVYRVMDVGVRSTRLYEIFSNTVVFVPNSKLAGQNIINFNRPNNRMKVRIDVSVSYGSDVSKVISVLKDIAMSHPRVLKHGEFEPQVIFREFGSSSLNFSLYIWIDDVMEQWRVPSEIREEIINRFRKEDIEIPFPQMDVHIKPVKPAK